MESPIPPDPYEALGVTKSADAAAVKSIYRKLVLKCHPDKVADENLKAQAVEQFHRIQQAYEILIDDAKRARYDAQVRLAELRKEALERGTSGPRVEVRARSYESGSRETSGSYPPRTTTREFEVRVPKFTDDYDEPRYTKPTKEYSRRVSPRRSRTPERERDRRARETERVRAERERVRDAGVRSERSRKYASATVEEVRDDDFARFEERRRKNDDEQRRYEETSKYRESEVVDERYRKLKDMEADARTYMSHSKEGRPRIVRTGSSQYAEVRRSSAARRGEPVRTASSPKEARRGSVPETIDERVPPPLKTYNSSPPVVEEPRHISIPRTQTFPERYERPEPTPLQSFHRSATMPNPQPTSSSPTSRRKENIIPIHSSKLRTSESSPPEPVYAVTPEAPAYHHPGIPPAATTTTAQPKYTSYHYPSEYKGATVEIRAPTEGRRGRSPSPPRREARPSLATHRTVPVVESRYAPPPPPPTRTYTYAYPSTSTQRSPEGARIVSPDRERRRSPERSSRRRESEAAPRKGMYYGEIPSPYTDRSRAAYYNPEQVATSKRITKDDVIYVGGPTSKSGRRDIDRDREYVRPGMSRTSTTVF